MHVQVFFFTLLSTANVRSTFDIICSSRQQSTTLSHAKPAYKIFSDKGTEARSVEIAWYY